MIDKSLETNYVVLNSIISEGFESGYLLFQDSLISLLVKNSILKEDQKILWFKIKCTHLLQQNTIFSDIDIWKNNGYIKEMFVSPKPG